MKDHSIFSLAKLLGAKNISNSPLGQSISNSPAALNYSSTQDRYDNLQNQLAHSTNAGESIGTGIAYYLASKDRRKALDDLNSELQARAAKDEEKRSTLAGLFPEDQRSIANTLDMETLTNLASKKLSQDPNAAADSQLDRQYKRAQIDSLNRRNSQPVNPQTGEPYKPLPTPAVKLQNEELDTIGTLGGINADLEKIKNQVDSGDLKLGPVENVKSSVKNYFGASDDNSRKFASFKATLEKQRNDSLRLNKGVQTEGDAVRAWNEVFQNINDPRLVSQRLGEVHSINKRGAELKKLNVETLRSNYGAPPLDYSQYENRPAAIGQNQSSGPRKRVYNPSTGRLE